MAMMTEQELDKIWDALWLETTDRSKGSFKRALWYGGKKSTMVGFDKGARKAIRNAPRKLLTLGVKQIPEVGSILGKVSGRPERSRRSIRSTSSRSSRKRPLVLKPAARSQNAR